MLRFGFAKLVRDKIVDHQLASGARSVYHQLTPDEHKRALIAKIIEEAAEISAASPAEIATEIADVQQALDDLKLLYGLRDADIAVAQKSKRAKNGAFAKGIFIEYVEVADDDPWVTYFRQHPDRYPELES